MVARVLRGVLLASGAAFAVFIPFSAAPEVSFSPPAHLAVDLTDTPLAIVAIGDVHRLPWRITWGDGTSTPWWSSHDRLDGYRHRYEHPGRYLVTLESLRTWQHGHPVGYPAATAEILLPRPVRSAPQLTLWHYLVLSFATVIGTWLILRNHPLRKS